MPINGLSKSLEEKAEKELNEVPRQRKENINHIKDWLKKQPHLHARTDDLFLLNFLRGCKFSLQKTKEKLEMYYTLRTATPEFFKNRDPLSPGIQDVLNKRCVWWKNRNASWMVVPIELPDMTVTFFRWKDTDPEDVPFEIIIKVALMLLDIALYENPTFMISGYYIIDDFEGFPFGYLQQMTPTLFKKLFYILQRAYPLRIKKFYLINGPTFMDKLVNTLGKPFITKKLYERIEISSDCNSIRKDIPKSILPKDYGGDGCSVEEITDKLKKKVEDYRCWFLEDENYRSNETMRANRAKIAGDIYGLEGSFRKLEID